jgi:hypothetical protein
VAPTENGAGKSPKYPRAPSSPFRPLRLMEAMKAFFSTLQSAVLTRSCQVCCFAHNLFHFPLLQFFIQDYLPFCHSLVASSVLQLIIMYEEWYSTQYHHYNDSFNLEWEIFGIRTLKASRWLGPLEMLSAQAILGWLESGARGSGDSFSRFCLM